MKNIKIPIEIEIRFVTGINIYFLIHLTHWYGWRLRDETVLPIREMQMKIYLVVNIGT